jgi:hypothetical protein
MGKAGQMLDPKADLVEMLRHSVGQDPAPEAVGRNQRLAHDIPDPHARIEGRIGVLEHDGEPLAPSLLSFVCSSGLKVDAFETHAAAIGADQMQKRQRYGRLAAARLAYERQGFSRAHCEADVLDSANGAVTCRKSLG